MHILVLGGYGFIGSAIVRRLASDGHRITGLGRSIAAAERRFPQARWIAANLAKLAVPDDWRPHLSDIDAVVNAAGALQDAPGISLQAIHQTSMVALYAACERAGVRRVVQISAVGARPEASSNFMRTKAAADGALARTTLDWTLLRPGLVIGAKAYGGMALLRSLAAFPIVIPAALPDTPVRTVALNEVVEAVAAALDGRLPARAAYDLVETEPHTFAEVVVEVRRWLGYRHAPIVRMPAWTTDAASAVADMLGYLGWRSPLRSNAMRVMREGIGGDSSAYVDAIRRRPSSLRETLAALPAGAEDGWFARLYLLKPILFAALALFWIVSGLVGLARINAASLILTDAGVGATFAKSAVVFGSVGDIAAGLLISHRRTTRIGLFAAIALSGAYLLGASVATPWLWVDPLGPLIKAVPAALLAFAALAILDDRG